MEVLPPSPSQISPMSTPALAQGPMSPKGRGRGGERKPAVKRARKPAVKRERKPAVKKEKVVKESDEKPTPTSKKSAGTKRKSVGDEGEPPIATKKPRKGSAVAGETKATAKRKSVDDGQEAGGPAVKRQRKRSTASGALKGKVQSEAPQNPGFQPLERIDEENPGTSDERPHWVDVIINQGKPTEREYRLPVNDMVEHSKLFSERFRGSEGWKELKVDSNDGKTPILSLRRNIDPKIFEAVVHALIFRPRYSLREFYRTTRQPKGTDPTETMSWNVRCLKRYKWTFESLMEAYYVADYLGCPNMCDVLMTEIILEHHSSYTICAGDCALGDLCSAGKICQDPAKMRPVFEFFQKTSLDCSGRDYFLDFYLLHRDLVRGMYSAGKAKEWSDKAFWMEFVDALDGPTPVSELTQWSEVDLCCHHEHQKDDSLVCPCELKAVDETERDIQDVFQDIIDVIRNIEEESLIIAKERSPVECQGVVKTPKEVMLELLEHARAILVCAKEIQRRIVPGEDSDKQNDEAHVPSDGYIELYQELVDEVFTKWSEFKAGEELKGRIMLSVRQKLGGKSLPKG